jgi:hypothetical protein
LTRNGPGRASRAGWQPFSPAEVIMEFTAFDPAATTPGAMTAGI